MGFVETHSHLLPFVDDGISSKEAFIEVVEAYKKGGFSHIVVTPHLYNPYVTTRTEHIRPMYEWAKGEAAARNIELILGAETYIGGAIEPHLIPFFSKYILIEVDWYTEPHFLLNRLYSLIKRGYYVILAHIDRYKWFSASSPLVFKLREMGLLFQANVDAVLEGRVDTYLQKKMVDIIASDNHGDVTLVKKFVSALEAHPDIAERMNMMFLN